MRAALPSHEGDTHGATSLKGLSATRRGCEGTQGPSNHCRRRFRVAELFAGVELPRVCSAGTSTEFWDGCPAVFSPEDISKGHLARECRFSKMVRDLIKRKQAEGRLLESEEHLRLFIENVNDYSLFEVDA